MDLTPRASLVAALAGHITGLGLGHPRRVAVDGITASGKTTLAGELADHLRVLGHAVDRLSMDGYHHPRAHRHRQGRSSADGYYEDAYDLTAFGTEVLDALGPAGAWTYRSAIHDLATDEPVNPTRRPLTEDGLLVVDGSFLQRAELAGRWDVVIFVDVPFDVALRRGAARDAAALGGLDNAERLFEVRYHAAARRYLAEVHPREHADIVVDNTDTALPTLRFTTSNEP